MKNYIRSDAIGTTPQILNIAYQGSDYQFSIIHAGLETGMLAATGKTWLPRKTHAHNVYHMVLFVEGNNIFQLNGKRHHTRPGVLVLTSPGELHEFYPCIPGEIVYMEICFELVNGGNALQLPFHRILSLYTGVELLPITFPIRLNHRQAERLAGMMTLLLERLEKRDHLYQLAASKSVLDVMTCIVQEIYLPGVTLPSTDVSPLLRAKEEIERRYQEHLTLEELAGLAGLSVGYFSRAFKQEFKISPIAYQRELRIQAAKNLLLTTGLRSKEIALRTGFEDPYFFTKTFKQIAGVTPTDFRKHIHDVTDESPCEASAPSTMT
ncbi:MAG TPA: AraC family transcriptional regulator [Armatimonadota bacterium]|nr:AraC family transcriptional regulator [Armatimonadota bacterium]